MERPITSADCLKYALDKIQQNPLLIRNHVSLHNVEERKEFDSILWPAVFNTSTWYRRDTVRPRMDPEELYLSGNTKVIRYYENDVWLDHGKVLVIIVTEEYDEIQDFEVKVRW